MQIANIPTDTFSRMVKTLLADGWKKTEEYDNVDAWIDYGMVVLQKDEMRLRFEWDNWMEGIVEGQQDILEKIRDRFNLQNSHGATQ